MSFDKSLRLGITYKGGFITEAKIEEAFDQGGFSFEGQAVVDLNTQKTVMTEMFMRWKHKGAVINAEDFIKKINVVSRNPKYKQNISKLRREYTNKEAPGKLSPTILMFLNYWQAMICKISLTNLHQVNK